MIDDGAQRFYRTGGEHVAPHGSIILVNADEIRTGSLAADNGWVYQAMYPNPYLWGALFAVILAFFLRNTLIVVVLSLLMFITLRGLL